MDRDAGALTGRVDAGDAGRAELVRFDPAHRVVHPGQDRNRRVDRVLAGGVECQLANLREAFEDLLAAEVAQVEEDAAVDAAAFRDLGPLGSADDVA